MCRTKIVGKFGGALFVFFWGRIANQQFLSKRLRKRVKQLMQTGGIVEISLEMKDCINSKNFNS